MIENIPDGFGVPFGPLFWPPKELNFLGIYGRVLIFWLPRIVLRASEPLVVLWQWVLRDSSSFPGGTFSAATSSGRTKSSG